MSKPLSTPQTLELLDQLRNAIAGFARREEALRKEYNSTLARSRREIEAATREKLNVLAAESESANAAHAEESARIEAHFQKRKTAITRAYKNCAPSRIKKLEAEEQQKKSELQQEFSESNRRRDDEVREAGERLAQFNETLAAERALLDELQDRARRSLRGHGSLSKRLLSAPEPSAQPDSADEETLLDQLRKTLAEIESSVARLRSAPLVALFRILPLWLLTLLAAILCVAAPFVLPRFGVEGIGYPHAGGAFAAAVVLLLLLHWAGARTALEPAKKLATVLARARQLHDACSAKAVAHHQSRLDQAQNDAAERTKTIQASWKETEKGARRRRHDRERETDQQVMRLNRRNEAFRLRRIQQAEQKRDDLIARAKREMDDLQRDSGASQDEETRRQQSRHESAWQELVGEWNATVPLIYKKLEDSRELAADLFPEWNSDWVNQWNPPAAFCESSLYGHAQIHVPELAGALPTDDRLTLPSPASFLVPLTLSMPEAGSLLLETKNAGREQAVATLNDIILRLFSVTPPGRANFTIIDPVELGQNFAGLMHLADFEDRLINGRIWTQTAQIEQQLANLNEHIEKVTQMYLRNEYASIVEYNQQAGRIAEKYHYLVIADFPVNFSETAAKRLLSIAASGPRCGVYTLIHWDQRRTAPAEFVPDDLRKNSICLVRGPGEFVFAGRNPEGLKVELESPPSSELATAFLQKVGQASIDSSRVEMPFEEVMPPAEEVWSLDTTQELRVPVGRTGATKLQYLSLGKGTRQHALVAGKTGSGKSTLFHVIITNLSLWVSPEQVEFYLVDFKKGVEFKCYGAHRLPHARVVAIESDREFGLSVLRRLDDELKRRGDLFRKLGVQDVPGYKKAGGAEPLPRTLLLIDEFQELFVDDDKIASEAALLLDRIVRQGRAFGIHVILGSQTLGGAYTLARTTLGQMVVRVALQCNEADAYLIMDDSNPAPRMLSRPGEAIYNDAAGSIEGNSPFQVVWLPDEERDEMLQKVRQTAEQRGVVGRMPFVFEGNAPADIHENEVLETLLKAGTIQPVATPRIWLGAPNSIKGPTEVIFQRQSGNNLLIVGQRDETAITMISVSLLALSAQHPADTVKFAVIDCTPPESSQREFLERAVAAVPHEITLAGNSDLDEVLKQFADELERRSEPGQETTGATHFLFIHGLQRFKKLRQEEDFGFSLEDTATEIKPGALLTKLITEGPAHGFHVICSCDSVNNVTRFIGRKGLGEFELRVLFQMSANDSAMLIDSPKAGNLGLHRALLHNEQAGTLETFRPYAMPGRDWIEQAAANLGAALKLKSSAAPPGRS